MCNDRGSCQGFTYRLPSGVDSCTSPFTSKVKIYLKSASNAIPDAAWCKVLKPPTPIGVFFENVETLRSIEFGA